MLGTAYSKVLSILLLATASKTPAGEKKDNSEDGNGEKKKKKEDLARHTSAGSYEANHEERRQGVQVVRMAQALDEPYHIRMPQEEKV